MRFACPMRISISPSLPRSTRIISNNIRSLEDGDLPNEMLRKARDIFEEWFGTD